MKRVAMCVLCIVFILMPYMTLADSNASNLKPAQDQPRPQSVDEKNGTSVIGTKLPLDIISTGSDQSGTLLSYKLKEELMASKLFTLTAAEKRNSFCTCRPSLNSPTGHPSPPYTPLPWSIRKILEH